MMGVSESFSVSCLSVGEELLAGIVRPRTERKKERDGEG